jgi:hypothetical protein
MRTVFAWILVASAGLAPVAAQEHLEPEKGHWLSPMTFERQTKFSSKIMEIFEREVFVRAVVLPSFGDYYTVGIRKTEAGFEAILLLERRLKFSAHKLAEIRTGY